MPPRGSVSERVSPVIGTTVAVLVTSDFLFGEFGLVNQLGSIDYARPRKFREKLEG